MPRLSKEQLHRKLDYHYKAFDRSQLSPDPLEFPHRYSSKEDIEIAAFISSVFAYGNIKQIMDSLENLFILIQNEPHKFVTDYKLKDGFKLFENIKHRFYTSDDIAVLFYLIHHVYKNYGSLKYYFLLYYFDKDKNIKNSLSFFSNNLKCISRKMGYFTNGIQFMFPDPLTGSACKRMNLFLRWMVRKDELDFGLWHEISTDKLVIPVDTHIAKISKSLKLTKRKTVSWKMAEEITENLMKFNPKDPVKYDFAICHIGMRKLKF